VDQAAVVLVWVAYLLYAAAVTVLLGGLLAQRPGLGRLGLAGGAVGLAAHSAALLLRGLEAGRVPFVGAYESLLLVAWAVAVVWHVLEALTRVRAVGLYVLPVVLVLMTAALAAYNPPVGLAPALKSDVVVVHVAVMLPALGCLYLPGGAGALFLVQDALLRRPRAGAVLGRLPSLVTLDRLVFHAALVGWPLLTAALAAGVARAETFGVPGWPGDPLVVLSGAAWAVYGALLGGRSRAGWSGGAVAWLAVAGVVLLLAIRFVAVPYLSGFHTYGG